jgi:lipooligosaccharide transport system permease protein
MTAGPTSPATATAAPRVSVVLRLTPPALFGTRRAGRLVERNVYVYRRGWLILVSGFFEPFFYLLSIGIGLSALVGPLHVGNRLVSYVVYVAPGLLASSAMNGALFDSTFNLFFKLKFAHTYETVLATPLTVADVAMGEMGWSLIRAGLYAASFMCVMAGLGYVGTTWVVLCYPGALLVAFAFSAIGMSATTYMRSWQDFDMVLLAILPLFLFSATFYPLSVYPGWLQAVVRCTPLYQGVALLRGTDLGIFNWAMVGHAAYLAGVGLTGLVVTSRRLGRLLLP